MAKIDLFGRHKKQIWQELCLLIDADFFDTGRWKPDYIEAYHGNWVITIDTFNTDKMAFTRIRAPYVNRDDFHFKIYRANFLHGIGKKMGMQDIEVGYPEFDKDFIIQGNDKRKLQMMFENPHIRNLISFQPQIHFGINKQVPWPQKKFPKGINEVYFLVPTILKDLNQLHDLYDLFAITLDHLCHIGSAYEDDPAFSYYQS